MNGDAREAALGLLGLSPTNSILPLKRKQSTTTTTTEGIDCICGFTDDDGFSIACDDCSRWCHAACFDVVDGDVPEEWRCWECVPRPVDRERAVKLQKARQRQQQLQFQQQQQALQPPILHLDHQRPYARIRTNQTVERKPRSRVNTVPTPTTDSPAPTTGKRKRRSSVSAVSSTITVYATTEDEHVDIDDPWAQSYVHINHDVVPHQDTRDKLRRQAQHWRGVTAISSSDPTTPVQLSPTTLPVRTSLHPLPSSSYAHPTLSHTNPGVRPPSYVLHTTSPVPQSHYIAPFRSTITPSSTYLSDPLNAYAHLGLPKPFVHLLGAPLDLSLDARIAGSKSRFVRNGCRPNAVLRPVICADDNDANATTTSLTFGVFALRDLKPNEEIVLGWEWDDGHAVHALPALIETPELFPPLACPSPHQLSFLRNQMANVLHALGSTFTTCACGARARDCALTQMAAFVDGETPVPRSVQSPSGSTSSNSNSNGSGSIALGPLVGKERGFLTRERVPWSGGMSGVEMVGPVGPDLPVVTLSPASPQKKVTTTTTDGETESSGTLPPKLRKRWIDTNDNTDKLRISSPSPASPSVGSAVSPSTSFARLSLRSPIRELDKYAVERDRAVSVSPTPREMVERSGLLATTSMGRDVHTARSSLSPLPSPLSPPPVSEQEPESEPEHEHEHEHEHELDLEPEPGFEPEPESDHEHIREREPSPIHRDPTPRPRTPTPPPPPPPQPKVKMSLKDFAMRRKKKREEEELLLAKVLASPESGPGAGPDLATTHPHVHSSDTDVVMEDPPPPPPPPTTTTTTLTHPNTDTVEAKMEIVEEDTIPIPVPRGLVCPDDTSDTSSPAPEAPEMIRRSRSLNGDIERSFPVSITGKRRPPTQPQPPPPRRSPFMPRSHSPPTQPRSFQQTNSASTSVVSTPTTTVILTPPLYPRTLLSPSTSNSTNSNSNTAPPTSYRHRSQTHPYSYSTPHSGPFIPGPGAGPGGAGTSSSSSSSSSGGRPPPRGPRALQVNANIANIANNNGNNNDGGHGHGPTRGWNPWQRGGNASGGPSPPPPPSQVQQQQPTQPPTQPSPLPQQLQLPMPMPMPMPSLATPPHSIPRRPSADRERERLEWQREWEREKEREKLEWARERGRDLARERGWVTRPPMSMSMPMSMGRGRGGPGPGPGSGSGPGGGNVSGWR